MPGCDEDILKWWCGRRLTQRWLHTSIIRYWVATSVSSRRSARERCIVDTVLLTPAFLLLGITDLFSLNLLLESSKLGTLLKPTFSC